MALGYANLPERAIVTVMGKAKGGNAGGIRLKREHNQLEHKLDVFGVAGRNAGVDSGYQDLLRVPKLFSLLNARFNGAHAGEILVELVFVARGQPLLQPTRVFEHEIQHGPLLQPVAFRGFGALTGCSGAKEPLESEARIGLRRHRRGGRTPGDVELIGTGIIRIAGLADCSHVVASSVRGMGNG